VELTSATFDSDPPGARVYLDGVLIGRTPLRDHPVSVGAHQILFENDAGSLARELRIGGRHGNRSFEWRGAELLVR
jgi:hypothetical protein